MRMRLGRQPAQHLAECEVRVMDTNGLNQLQHRCGTCSEIFQSIEELCKHARVHARPTDGRSEPASANRYRYDSVLYANSVENSHWLHRGRTVKVLLSDEC
jgi:hypothetical protein